MGIVAGMANPPLELLSRSEDPPRITPATPIEGKSFEIRQVPGAPTPGFAAFLDGIQNSRALAYIGPVPVVYGAAAAAVRVRESKRLSTWNEPRTSRQLYFPASALPADIRAALAAHPGTFTVVDTDLPAGIHPQEYLTNAVAQVKKERERLERGLISDWIARESRPLLVDGGISGAGDGSSHPLPVGVIKSHQTIYAPADSLGQLFRMKEGERSSVLEIKSELRQTVASWYLRIRTPRGGESPFFGLVRVEVARNTGDISGRADQVSRWILAERSPVSLPDGRWDTMVYGIRDCEQYLSAIL